MPSTWSRSWRANMRDIPFMHFRKVHMRGREVWALGQTMAGEVGFELQGPPYSREIYDAVLKDEEEFGIRRLGGRAVFINHLEACYPTIITDYLPAMFGEDMKEYLRSLKRPCPDLPSPSASPAASRQTTSAPGTGAPSTRLAKGGQVRPRLHRAQGA